MGVRLGDVLRDLMIKKFTGEGAGKYYPRGSGTAYYRMSYFPAKMELRHKSPWSPGEERIVVQYAEDFLDFKTIDFYLDNRHYKTLTGDKPYEGDNDDGLGIFTKYLFNDPRLALMWAESIQPLPAEGSGECNAITVLDLPDYIKVVCDFFTDDRGQLTKMRIHQFLMGKEMRSQNMDIFFAMPE